MIGGVKSGFIAILVALQIEYDSSSFFLTTEQIFNVPLIHSLLILSVLSVISVRNGSDSRGTLWQELCSSDSCINLIRSSPCAAFSLWWGKLYSQATTLNFKLCFQKHQPSLNQWNKMGFCRGSSLQQHGSENTQIHQNPWEHRTYECVGVTERAAGRHRLPLKSTSVCGIWDYHEGLWENLFFCWRLKAAPGEHTIQQWCIMGEVLIVFACINV